MKFNAGSEIYTENLVHGLLNEGMDVQVFSRDEDPFHPEYVIHTENRTNGNGNTYLLNLVNVPRQKDRYQSDGVDKQFSTVVEKFNPDIIHFNHLNHLSLGLVDIAYRKQIKMIFTLHDFWLACPRGQFLQINYGEEEPYKLCDGQENRKCAIHCYSRYYSGKKPNDEDVKYWAKWINKRQQIIKGIIEKIDLFIAPSSSLMKRMQHELNIPSEKIVLLDYGFNVSRLSGRTQRSTEPSSNNLVFGYIGTHIVAKGIHHLLDAFVMTKGEAKLYIFGRSRPETTPYLKNKYPSDRIVWKDEYMNEDIVVEVFNQVDVIVVPSIWEEISPLVIHEAQQMRVPVITANAGGMADYVKHEDNGLLFSHRDPDLLKDQIQRIIDDPGLIEILGRRGYLYTKSGDIITLEEHISKIIELYKEVLQ